MMIWRRCEVTTTNAANHRDRFMKSDARSASTGFSIIWVLVELLAETGRQIHIIFEHDYHALQ